MTYVLHGARSSGSCAVECVLAEIGADYELRELSLRDDEQRGEEYAAVNAHRKVPSLVIDDGSVLTESVAIVLTLDDRHPEMALLPAKGAPARAQALRWLLFAATEIYPIVEINDYPERFATDPDQTDAMRERAREIWRARWLVVEANLAGDPTPGTSPRARRVPTALPGPCRGSPLNSSKNSAVVRSGAMAPIIACQMTTAAPTPLHPTPEPESSIRHGVRRSRGRRSTRFLRRSSDETRFASHLCLTILQSSYMTLLNPL